jgi:serine/threonine protein kinase
MNKYIFNAVISGFSSWGKIYQSVEAWKSLVNFILEKEKLPVSKIENLKPGTNAVFKAGKYVVKIFAPKESGFDGSRDYETEKYAMSFACSLGVSVSKLISSGKIDDKYNFLYMIMEYIDGEDFNEYTKDFSDKEKIIIAKRLREITDSFNKECELFNGIDVIHDKNRHKRWDNYSDKFRQERLEYLDNNVFGEKVFVHGDLCYDNLLIDNKGNIHIIDFADSVVAPLVYEHAHLASVLFNFDKSYLYGYFGEYAVDSIIDLCFDGLLIHDFGGDIVLQNIARANEINCLNDLRDKLYGLLQ